MYQQQNLKGSQTSGIRPIGNINPGRVMKVVPPINSPIVEGLQRPFHGFAVLLSSIGPQPKPSQGEVEVQYRHQHLTNSYPLNISRPPHPLCVSGAAHLYILARVGRWHMGTGSGRAAAL